MKRIRERSLRCIRPGIAVGAMVDRKLNRNLAAHPGIMAHSRLMLSRFKGHAMIIMESFVQQESAHWKDHNTPKLHRTVADAGR